MQTILAILLVAVYLSTIECRSNPFEDKIIEKMEEKFQVKVKRRDK